MAQLKYFMSIRKADLANFVEKITDTYPQELRYFCDPDMRYIYRVYERTRYKNTYQIYRKEA